MKITTIIPTYSQSNGLAEKAVHIVKNMLGKGGNLIDGLMEYCNTPISNFPYSPNQTTQPASSYTGSSPPHNVSATSL